MAVHAPITGASSGATIISFPMPPARRFRVELSRCNKSKMIDAWLSRLQRTDNGLTEREYLDLAMRRLRRSRQLRAEGC